MNTIDKAIKNMDASSVDQIIEKLKRKYEGQIRDGGNIYVFSKSPSKKNDKPGYSAYTVTFGFKNNKGETERKTELVYISSGEGAE